MDPSYPTTPPRLSPSTRLWQSLILWRGIALLAVIAALVLAVLRPHPVAGPDLVAVLQPTQAAPPASPGTSRLIFTVALYPDGSVAVQPLSTRKPPKGKVWQLWAIAPSERPVAVGLVHAGKPTRLGPGDVPGSLRHAHVLIAVSVEPPKGSASGLPTGPMVFTGPLLRLR